MLGRALVVSAVVGCVPAVEDAPPTPAPVVKLPDAVIDASIDAPPPDARVLSRPGKLSCRWQHGDATELAFSSYRFHGVVPWVGFGDPVTSNCCVLPNQTVLCHVTEKTWNYFKVEGGTMASPLYVEHTRLFDKNGKQPWFDVVTKAFEPGPMNDSYGKAGPPLFQAHIENDEDAFWIVGDRDRACEPNRKLPCDEALIESKGCGAYRKRLAPMVKSFCDARGPHVWRDARFE